MQTGFNLRDSIVDPLTNNVNINNNYVQTTIGNGLTGGLIGAGVRGLPIGVSGLTTGLTNGIVEQQSIWNQGGLNEVSRLPRLFPISGLNEQVVEKVIEQIRGVPTDLATQCLLQPTSVLPVGTHPCRGFTILNGKQTIQEIRKVETTGPRPVCLVFNGIGSQWYGIGQELMTMDVFRQSILRSVEVLKPFGINLLDLIQGKQQVFERTLNSFVGITAVQIALIDCLRHIGIVPEFYIGHSIGELACAYADNCLSAEQALLTAFQCGKSIEEVQWPVTCAVANVGLTWEEVARRCPSGVVPTWQHAQECVTVCGPRNLIVQFVKELSYEGILAKVDETMTVPFHSMYMNPVVSQLKQALERIIVTPKLRSSRWISSSIPEQRWSTELGRYFSPEYFVNNLCSPVLLQEGLRRLPVNGVVVEVGPQALLQGLLRRTLGQQVPVIPLIQRDVSYPLENFLTQLGKLYLEGVNLDAVKLVVPLGREQTLYPLPVQVTTGPFARWVKVEPQQAQIFEPTIVNGGSRLTAGGLYPVQTFKYLVDPTNVVEDAYLTGHQINGQIVYPTTGYLQLIWKSLAQLNGYQSFERIPVQFENVEFFRHTIVPRVQQRQITFVVSIVPKTGQFELVEGGNVIVSGRVFVPEQGATIVPPTTFNYSGRQLLEKDEIYKNLKTRGYEYQGEFTPIIKCDVEGTYGELLWTGKWVPFLESMIQMNVLGQKSGLLLPNRIRSLCIDPTVQMQTQKLINRIVRSAEPFGVSKLVGGLIGGAYENNNISTMPIVLDRLTNKMVCGGVEIIGLNTITSPIRSSTLPAVGIDNVNFVPYFEKQLNDDEYVIVDKVLGKGEDIMPEFGVYNPLVESTVRQNREFFQFYLNECQRVVQHILRKVEQPTLTSQSIVLGQLPQTLEQQLDNLRIAGARQSIPVYSQLLEGGKLLQLLLQAANVDSTDGQYLLKVQSILNDKFAYLKALEEDCVLNFANNRCYYLKNIIDTVLENTQIQQLFQLKQLIDLRQPQTKLRVLEISPSMSHFFGGKVNNLLKVFPQLAGEIEYHYVPTLVSGENLTVQPEEYLRELNAQIPFPIRRVEWNLSQKLNEVPANLRDYDLVILNGGLSSVLPIVGGNEYELKRWLQTITEKVLRPQGFLFVHEYTNNFDLIQQLTRLEQIAQIRQQFIQQQQNGSPLFQQKLQSEAQWRQLIEGAGLLPVSLKSDIELSSMLLYRRPLIVGSGIGEERVQIDNVDQLAWIKKVKLAILDDKIERVWVISEQMPSTGIVALINNLRKELGGEKIRCVFVADKQPIVSGRYLTPVEQLVMPKTLQWTQLFDQIRKADLVMNVFRNGQWGSYRQVMETPLMEEIIQSSAQLPLDKQQLYRMYGQVPAVISAEQILSNLTANCGGGIEQQFEQTLGLRNSIRLSPIQTYVITGGLAGFGLELAQWLVEHGARRIVITSKVGVRTDYQVRKLRILRDEFNAQIQVLPLDVTQELECLRLIREATQMSIEKKIGGIFHLSGLWEDMPYEIQQTLQKVQIQQQLRQLVEGVRCLGAWNLDKCLRSERVMDDSAYFCVFVPVFGSQTVVPTTYTTLEKICELRRREGKHVLTVQWGFNGELGLTTDYVFGGVESEEFPVSTIPRRIVPCLRVLENLLIKSCEPRENAIYSSYVPIEKILNQEIQQQFSQPKSLIERIFAISGVRDIQKVLSNEQITLGELGLTEVMCIEIKKLLEQIYNLPLTPVEIQQLTIKKLRSLELSQYPTTRLGGYPSTIAQRVRGIDYLMPIRNIERLNQIELTQNQVPLVVIHPIEGTIDMLRNWAKNIQVPVFGVQFTPEALQCETIEQLGEFYWSQIEREIFTPLNMIPRIHLCGFSFGAQVAYEIAAKRNNRIVSLTFLDGSHSYVNNQVSLLKQRLIEVEAINEIESEILLTFLQQHLPTVQRREIIQDLIRMPTLEQRVMRVVRELLTKSQAQFDQVDLELAVRSYVVKMLMAIRYQPRQSLNLNELLLVKSIAGQSNIIQTILGQDYGLGQVFGGKLNVHVIDAEQQSLFESSNGLRLATILNEYLPRCL